jgi:hypothetical protein
MKTAYFLILTLVIFSCKKENDSTLALTGNWKFTITMQGNYIRYCNLNLVQNDNNALAGSITDTSFIDNTFIINEMKLLSTSKIKGDSVLIDCLWQDPAILNFRGIVNSKFNQMNGSYFSNVDYVPGTWSAIKSYK